MTYNVVGMNDCFTNSFKAILHDNVITFIAPIYVGYSEMSYTAMEGEGVIVCIEITSHSNEGAPRPFSVMLATENGTAGILLHKTMYSPYNVVAVLL